MGKETDGRRLAKTKPKTGVLELDQRARDTDRQTDRQTEKDSICVIDDKKRPATFVSTYMKIGICEWVP